MTSIFEQLRLLHPGPRDLIEVLVVAFVLYRMLLLIQGISETIKSVWAARTGIELEHKEKIEV